MSMSMVRFGACALAGASIMAITEATMAQEADPVGDVTYVIEIDCSRRASLQEGTRALYTIVGLADNGEEHSFTPTDADMSRLTEADCVGGVAPFELTGPFTGDQRIGVFRIELLSGPFSEDALFLDSLQFTRIGPDYEDSMGWDEDGKYGWCLSFDPDDAWRGITYDDMCFPCLEFSVIAETEDSPVIDGDWRRTAAPGYSACAPLAEAFPPD